MIDLKWLKKWIYLLLLAGTGVVYLAVVDKWQVYAEPIAMVKEQLGGSIQQSGEEENSEDEESAGNVQTCEEGQESEDLQASGGETVSGVGDISGGETFSGEGDISGGEADSGDGQTEQKLPVYTSVEDDYFADAVFIGDSRTVGMYEYGGLEQISTFYASTGLTVYKLFDAEIVKVPGQKKKITVEEALEQNSFRKIYLMIGINEMGTGTVETFAEKYREVVEHLLELQPDSILYIQGIMKVTTERSEQGDYITNEGIEARNEAISGLADNERIFYLDVNPVICDETGGMVEDYTFDGVHLKAQYIENWKDFLKTHAIQ